MCIRDRFDPSVVNNLFEDFTIELYTGTVNVGGVTAVLEGSDEVYGITTATGTLRVRAVENGDGTESTNPVFGVQSTAPTTRLPSGDVYKRQVRYRVGVGGHIITLVILRINQGQQAAVCIVAVNRADVLNVQYFDIAVVSNVVRVDRVLHEVALNNASRSGINIDFNFLGAVPNGEGGVTIAIDGGAARRCV